MVSLLRALPLLAPLEELGIAAISGTSFGANGEGYIRFSYANSVENIVEAVSRIKAIL